MVPFLAPLAAAGRQSSPSSALLYNKGTVLGHRGPRQRQIATFTQPLWQARATCSSATAKGLSASFLDKRWGKKLLTCFLVLRYPSVDNGVLFLLSILIAENPAESDVSHVKTQFTFIDKLLYNGCHLYYFSTQT